MSGDGKHSVWWERYDHARGYQAAMKMTTLLPRYVDFYEGRQYPPMTARTKDVPRPMINMVEMICQIKKAIILSTAVRCVYRSPDGSGSAEGAVGMTTGVEGLNDFSEYISREMREDEVNNEIMLGGMITGTGIWHFYWDAEARGVDGTCEGGLRCESIDPLHFFCEDPTERDVQKQAWIIFSSRVPVRTVRAMADAGVDLRQITADESEDRFGGKSPGKQNEEQEGTELCTLLTCYFRRGGEVMVEKAVKGCIVNRAHPITPDREWARARLRADEALEEDNGENPRRMGDAPENPAGRSSGSHEDEANAPVPDKAEGGEAASEEVRKTQAAMSYLYPVEVWSYKNRMGSIYGRGEVEGIIHNQRTVNELLSSIAFNIKQTSWSKMTVRPGALKGQQVTNEPGQVLVDYSNTGDGFKYLQGSSPNAQAQNLVDLLVDLTRSASGATDVMSGETGYANMSGAAIAQLQSRAQVPMEDIRAGFWRALERCGRIKAQFFQTHYTGRVYSRRVRGNTVDEYGIPTEEWKTETFNSSDYAGVPLECVCEATTGTRSSAAGDIQILEHAYEKGEIDFRTLILCYPATAIGDRREILRALAEREQSAMAILQAQNEQLQAEMERMAAEMQAQAKSVERAEALVEANKRLRAQILELYTEFGFKIGEANTRIGELNDAYAVANADATEFASAIVEDMGLSVEAPAS